MDSRKRNFMGVCKLGLALLAATLLAFLLHLGSTARAQGEGMDQCTFGRGVHDNTCESQGYEAVTFTVPCKKKDYVFACGIICNSGNPYNCKVTSTVSRVSDGATIAICQNWDEEGCGGNGPSNSAVYLEEDVQYKLTVLFEACYQSSCPACADCYAWGRLTHP